MAAALKTPDITPAQAVAVAVAVITEFASAAVIDGRLAQLLTGLAGIVIPFAWIAADAVIRHGRSRNLTAVVAAPAAASPYTRNADGSWTRADGVRGIFGPAGFVPSVGGGSA
jgi:hypothetical protein